MRVPTARRTAFSVTIEPLAEARLIRASGEFDRSTAERLGSALDAARADGVTTLLDLSAISFIDSAGLRVLLRRARAVDAPHCAWFIVGASGVVRRLVEVSGTGSQLPLGARPACAERSAAVSSAAWSLNGDWAPD